jgi:hypothetical protein
MKHYFQTLLVAVLFSFGASQSTYGQKNLEKQISNSLTSIANGYTFVGRINLTSFQIDNKSGSVSVSANERLAYMPFRPENVKRIYAAIRSVLGSKYSGYDISCRVENKTIEELIPNLYRPQNYDSRKQFATTPLVHPLVTDLSRPYDIVSGLKNRHIALWQSHGKYFDQKHVRWEWQRPRVLQVVEDLYTQSYVLPFLVPMLENAGANVLLPRERDTQLNEVIVDNDTNSNTGKESRYRERNDRKSWKKSSGEGFGNTKKFYLQGENPFTFGTYKTIQAVSDIDETSSVEWYPNIPEAGRYAVYVSYKTLENSASDAHYTVYHRGIKTEFQVNQQLDGGTWLYLGHFYFDKGRNSQNKLVLTNFSTEDDKVITADAVKFGGGMGNIARTPGSTTNGTSDSLNMVSEPIKPAIVYEPMISRYPRYTEGARYWLQWAGVPDSVYSRTQGKNDYSDDFQSRGFWVNYLIGGSALAPNTRGLHVPVDLAMAFHTDAGSTANDSIIGTLGICSIPNSAGKTFFENGVSRWASRDLTDIIQTQIVADVRKLFAPEWTRRGLWNKSYSESRVPEVPTMLLELLSHQNFADMRYGLDPRFRFAVSRSIYKGMLKYLSAAQNIGYVVQPLPVEQFSCRFTDKNKLELHWLAVNDSLEPTAVAGQFRLYTRIDDGDFDNGVLITSNRAIATLQSGKIYSFKVVAVNAGGQSFPSETLSACRVANEKGQVMVVNGFERVSAPYSFSMDSAYAGFNNDKDPGVPYMSDISFVGKQYEFKHDKPWADDDSPGFGASYANFETTEIAGNTFDFPYLHGKAIKAAGYSFVSSGVKSVIRGDIDLTQYKIVDLILGEQKQTFVGNAKKTPEFKTFPLALQQSIQRFCVSGGNLLLSGAYIGSDLCDGPKPLKEDRQFIENVLKYKFRTSHASVGGTVSVVGSPFAQFRKADISYFAQPNSRSYYVGSPDAIEPVGEGSFCICRYSENNLGAAVAYSGAYKTCAFAFPLEALTSEKDRWILMDAVLQFFAVGK